MTDVERLQPLDEDWERALCVVAHPDDLEYGASSAVARWTAQGKQVVYVLATRGQAGLDSMRPEEAGAIREAEERESARIVGVDDVRFLDFDDGVIEYGLLLRHAIAREVRSVRPQVLVSLTGDLAWGNHALNQADHRNVALAAIDAARDAGNRWVFPDLIAAGLEPWGGARMVCFSGSPNPTHAVDVEGYLEQGIASLQAQKVYFEVLGGGFDLAAFLREGAEHAGKRLGVQLAVAFEVFTL
jgi:LmbE family N-acetylglucosaminyl deacetylase